MKINIILIARYHSHGGNLKVGEPPYKGMAEDFVRAGVEMGYPRIDLNAEFVQGIVIIIVALLHYYSSPLQCQW